MYVNIIDSCKKKTCSYGNNEWEYITTRHMRFLTRYFLWIKKCHEIFDFLFLQLDIRFSFLSFVCIFNNGYSVFHRWYINPRSEIIHKQTFIVKYPRMAFRSSLYVEKLFWFFISLNISHYWFRFYFLVVAIDSTILTSSVLETVSLLNPRLLCSCMWIVFFFSFSCMWIVMGITM